MKLRDLLVAALGTGDLDKPVKVRIVRRGKFEHHGHVEMGSVIAERYVDTVRFTRMSGPHCLEQDNYIVIEAEDLDNAKEIPS